MNLWKELAPHVPCPRCDDTGYDGVCRNFCCTCGLKMGEQVRRILGVRRG